MKQPLGLFEGFGIEIEYMIVDAGSLAVRPLADRLLVDDTGRTVSELSRGALAWCNELALHLVELKNNGPAESLDGLAAEFQRSVLDANRRLEPLGARLLPSGMHPWMVPDVESVLWPHDSNEVYATFDRIFDCNGHGWTNLQSTQLNLPFRDDAEFARLHAAIRLLLPIMPAMSASTPIVEGVVKGAADHRMRVYRTNCARVPSVSGLVVPERARDRTGYERDILGRIHRDLEPLDPEGVLRHEWINARGAIARFDRNAIEIRVLDTQECPAADIAVLAAIVGVLRSLVGERWSDLAEQDSFTTVELAALLWKVVDFAEAATVEDPRYLRALGCEANAPIPAGELWKDLLERTWDDAPADAARWYRSLSVILERGSLATRIHRAVMGDVRAERLREVYGELSDCLAAGRPFEP